MGGQNEEGVRFFQRKTESVYKEITETNIHTDRYGHDKFLQETRGRNGDNISEPYKPVSGRLRRAFKENKYHMEINVP